MKFYLILPKTQAGALRRFQSFLEKNFFIRMEGDFSYDTPFPRKKKGWPENPRLLETTHTIEFFHGKLKPFPATKEERMPQCRGTTSITSVLDISLDYSTSRMLDVQFKAIKKQLKDGIIDMEDAKEIAQETLEDYRSMIDVSFSLKRKRANSMSCCGVALFSVMDLFLMVHPRHVFPVLHVTFPWKYGMEHFSPYDKELEVHRKMAGNCISAKEWLQIRKHSVALLTGDKWIPGPMPLTQLVPDEARCHCAMGLRERCGVRDLYHREDMETLEDYTKTIPLSIFHAMEKEVYARPMTEEEKAAHARFSSLLGDTLFS